VAGPNDAKQDQQDDDDGELKLVTAPRAISKIEIGYARAAKKVDVKALKKGMWEKVHDKSNTKQPLRSFQQTMNNLKDELPEDELPSVSVPFCFICLLHLCNEQNLGLVADPTGNLGDFQVVQNKA
jgi:condensin complex subunit 2